MRMIRKRLWIGLLIVVYVALSISAYGAETAPIFHLTIFHNNDFHGYDPSNLARQAWLVNQARAQGLAQGLAQGWHVLFVNAGDVFARGRYHKVFYGEMEFAALNAMNLDAFTLGNNEFKATNEPVTAQKYLEDRLDQANFPVLCANIRWEKDGAYLTHVKPYIVKDMDGVRIGIFGVTAARTRYYPQARGMVVADPLETARRIYPAVAAESDIVIGLTHIGFGEDRKLARELPGLAAIVGGDSHTVLRTPFVGGGVPIVQAGGEWRQYLGRLELTFVKENGAWQLKESQGKLIPIDKKIPEDPKVKAIIDQYLAKVGKPAA